MANSAFTHEPSFNIPGSTTDNAVIRWDGTSGAGQLNSGIIIDDSNVITGVTSLTVDNLNVNGNTVISTDTNGNITFAPNGSGSVVADTVGNSEMSFNGTVLDIKNNGTQSSIKLYCETGNAHYQEIRGGPHSGATSYTMVLPHVPPTANQVLTTASISSNVAVLDWADAAGGTAVAGTTDNGILTFVNSGSTFAAESGVTFSSGVLRVDSESTSVSAIVSIEVDASSTGDPTVRWREGSGNGDANNQQYEAWMDTSGGQFRFRSQNIDGSSSEGDVWVINDGSNDVKFNGNVVIGTAGKGIDFAIQTQSTATTTAELLDHYEEGTFLPIITDNDGTQGTYSRQLGHYTKIGNSVSYTIDVIVNSLGSMTGGDTVRIGGLPFVAGVDDKAFAVGYGNSLAITAGNYVSGWISGNSSTGVFVVWDATTGATGMTITQLSAGGSFKMFGTYNT